MESIPGSMVGLCIHSGALPIFKTLFQGLGMWVDPKPRAVPWAGTDRRDCRRTDQFALEFVDSGERPTMAEK